MREHAVLVPSRDSPLLTGVRAEPRHTDSRHRSRAAGRGPRGEGRDAPPGLPLVLREDVDAERNASCFPSLSVTALRSLPAYDACFMF